MQDSLIGLVQLGHGMIPVSARLTGSSQCVVGMMLSSVGREHYRSLSHREMPDGGAVMSPSMVLPEVRRWSILLTSPKKLELRFSFSEMRLSRSRHRTAPGSLQTNGRWGNFSAPRVNQRRPANIFGWSGVVSFTVPYPAPPAPAPWPVRRPALASATRAFVGGSGDHRSRRTLAPCCPGSEPRSCRSPAPLHVL
jgi:hypothetical protein